MKLQKSVCCRHIFEEKITQIHEKSIYAQLPNSQRRRITLLICKDEYVSGKNALHTRTIFAEHFNFNDPHACVFSVWYLAFQGRHCYRDLPVRCSSPTVHAAGGRLLVYPREDSLEPSGKECHECSLRRPEKESKALLTVGILEQV